MNGISFDGWVPIRVYRAPQAGWSVDWCRLGGKRFDEPFFEQTIDAALRRPFNRMFRRCTPLDDLEGMFAADNAMRPAGLVFHISRCGSTLVARTLASLPASIVISEAVPIDDVIGARRHDPELSDAWREDRLRWIVSALARSVPGDPRRFIIKMDAWHVLDLALIRRAFPGVPWIFVYRDPVEVLVSHSRTPSWMMSAVNAKRLLGLEAPEMMALSRDAYHAQVLAALCRAVVDDGPRGGLLVNYSELPGAALDAIPRWCGIAVGAGEREAMRAAAELDAKRPSHRFVPDAKEKRGSASHAIRDAALHHVDGPYAALETLRTARRLPRQGGGPA
jgi:hypothetical protein